VITALSKKRSQAPAAVEGPRWKLTRLIVLPCKTAQIHGAEVGRVLNAVVAYRLAIGVVQLSQHSRSVGKADVHAAMHPGGRILLEDQLSPDWIT